MPFRENASVGSISPSRVGRIHWTGFIWTPVTPCWSPARSRLRAAPVSALKAQVPANTFSRPRQKRAELGDARFIDMSGVIVIVGQRITLAVFERHAAMNAGRIDQQQ